MQILLCAVSHSLCAQCAVCTVQLCNLQCTVCSVHNVQAIFVFFSLFSPGFHCIGHLGIRAGNAYKWNAQEEKKFWALRDERHWCIIGHVGIRAGNAILMNCTATATTKEICWCFRFHYIAWHTPEHKWLLSKNVCDLLPFYKIAHNISEMTPWDSASRDVVKYMVSANIWQTFEKELAKYISVLLV